MARLFGILGLILTLAACSSGVSNTGAGAAGTNCTGGGLDLVCTATVEPSNFSIDVYTDVDEQGQPVSDTSPATDTITMNITVTDPLGEFSQVFQGVTFQTFDISFDSGQGGAPNLGTRRFTETLNITLVDSVGSGSATFPMVDQVTKKQFAQQASGSTVFPYVVTVRATGRDFATNTPVVVVARTNIEIGNFEDSGGGGTGGGDDA